jgi:hypothetical protein
VLPIFLALAMQTSAFAYPCSSGSPLERLSFLAGDWKGEPKSGPVFEGFPGVLQSGDFRGQFEMKKWVLILRGGPSPDRNANLKPLLADMMIMYAGCGSEQGTGAVYIDGTHHTAQHCTFEVLYRPDRKPNGVVFVSKPEPNMPSFRLTYTEISPGRLSIELRAGVRTYISTAHHVGLE